jgi:5-bromo-4-chloroindolyl phosphate hydrolysis protein
MKKSQDLSYLENKKRLFLSKDLTHWIGKKTERYDFLKGKPKPTKTIWRQLKLTRI